MSLATPIQIRTLQRKLYLKAKAEPAYRFYLLYDKIYREDILAHAYELVKANQGAPGVDGRTFWGIETQGLAEWLAGIREELRAKTYQPQPVRRVMIPKPGGGERPLGIPTIRDRVVQTAAKLVLEPIFEADFDPNAYGYRPKRSAQDAIRKVHQLLCSGYTDVVDADLSKYFDTIPHCELMQCVARRIVDRDVLRLIKMWLKVPVEEKDDHGNRRMTGGKQNTRGTPQGGVISPMLANLYMNRFLKYWRITREGGCFPRPSGHLRGRFRDPESRLCEAGIGLDAAGDDADWTHSERSEDQHPAGTPGAVRLSGLHVRAVSLPERWPLVFGHGSIQEECFTGPAEDRSGAETQQRAALGGSSRSTQPCFAGLGGVLWPGYAVDGISGRRSSRLYPGSIVPDSATQGAKARRRALSGFRSPRDAWGAALAQSPSIVAVVSRRRSQSESRMLERGTSGLMSGAGKRGGASASVLALGLDSTLSGQP